MEEHLGPLRDALGISHEELMELGRENPGDRDEDVLHDRAGPASFPAAPTPFPLCTAKCRAHMWTGLFPGKPEDEVPIGHITNGVHVPSWLAPQMFRLYDRHLGTGWQENSGESAIWEGIENVDDGELWETHLEPEIPPAGFRAPPRRGAGRAPRRVAGNAATAGPRAQPGRADHRVCPPLRNLQAGQPACWPTSRSLPPW